jgi:hypothetical protein
MREQPTNSERQDTEAELKRSGTICRNRWREQPKTMATGGVLLAYAPGRAMGFNITHPNCIQFGIKLTILRLRICMLLIQTQR